MFFVFVFVLFFVFCLFVSCIFFIPSSKRDVILDTLKVCNSEKCRFLFAFFSLFYFDYFFGFSNSR